MKVGRIDLSQFNIALRAYYEANGSNAKRDAFLSYMTFDDVIELAALGVKYTRRLNEFAESQNAQIEDMPTPARNIFYSLVLKALYILLYCSVPAMHRQKWVREASEFVDLDNVI